MKVNELGWALLAAILLVSFSTPGHAEDKEVTAVPAQEFQGQDGLLQNLPRSVGAGFSRIFSHAATGGTAAGVSTESVAGVHRAQANQPCDVQRGACSEPANAEGSVHAF